MATPGYIVLILARFDSERPMEEPTKNPVFHAILVTSHQNTSTKEFGPIRSFTRWIPVVILAVSAVIYCAALTPERFGTYHDDSIYATTAKALAGGHGYRIVSLPYEPAQTKYPPFYPFLLSLVWKAHPHFPENLSWMMILSSVVTLGFLALTYRYLTKQGYATQSQALIVVALSAINWRTIVLATGLYSEMLYAALSVAVLFLAERDANKSANRFSGLVVGCLAGLAFLTRSSGLVLLIAVAIYYAMLKKWGRAIAVVGIGGLFVAGWIAWVYANKTSAQGINTAYYTSYLGHLSQTFRELQTQGNTSALTVYINTVVTNFIGGILVTIPLVCSGFNHNWVPSFSGSSAIIILSSLMVFLVLIAGFVRHISKGVRLLHIYIFSSFALYLFWLPGVAYDRFVMPLLPFLLLFMIREMSVLISLATKGLRSGHPPQRKLSAAFILVTLLTAIGINLFNYGAGIYWSLTPVKVTADRAAEDAEAFTWIDQNTDLSEALVCYRDPKFFLYTAHKAVRSLPMTEGFSWEEDQPSMDKLAGAIFGIIDEAKARYLVVTSSDFELEDRPEQHRKTFDLLIERHPRNFSLVFESSNAGTRIYRIQEISG